MIIEFFGPPGCGKTTLLDALLQIESSELIMIRPDSAAIHLSTGQIVAKVVNPISFIRWARLFPWFFRIATTKGWSTAQKKNLIAVAIIRYLELCKYAAVNQKESEHIVYDQNIFNFILAWLYLQDQVEDEQILKVMKYYLPYLKNYVIVLASLDLESNASRLIGRKKENGRFDACKGDELSANLKRNHSCFKRIARIIEDNGLPVIKLDMRNTPEENASLIVQVLKNHSEPDGMIGANP